MRHLKTLVLSAILSCFINASATGQNVAAPTASPAPATPQVAPRWLDARIRSEVARFSGNVFLYAKNLDTGATYSMNGEDPVRTASTIKVAVMIETFARVAEGKSKWTDEIVLTKEKKVSGAGILPELSDGLKISLRDGVRLMMTLSDNTATNMVLDVVTADAVNARMQTLGLVHTRSMRKVMGGGDSAEGKKEENKRWGLGRSSPREMVELLERMERGEVVSAEASKEMLELMKREQGRDGIGRNLTRMPKATKAGALDALRSDVGIIYSPKGRIAMAITTDDMPEINWSVDNAGLLLMSRLSEILVEGLAKR